jgi:hypothetical protein
VVIEAVVVPALFAELCEKSKLPLGRIGDVTRHRISR